MNSLSSISEQSFLKGYKKWIKLLLHLLFWVLSLGFFWLLFSRNTRDVSNTAIFIAILSPVVMAMTYFFNYRLIPKFLMKAHYFKFFWFGGITAIVGLWIIFMGGLFIWVWRAEFNLGEINATTVDLPMLTASLFFVVLLGVTIKLIRINQDEKYERERSEKERLMLDNQLKIKELKLLKEQLNPHFLFNTLNNIYGLTIEQSEKAPDLVLRLSSILDYMLYRTHQQEVLLKQEIKMITDYVAIEQHRFEGRYPIDFEVKGTVDEQLIAPLIFLPLIENCFKHGIRKTVHKAFVKIELRCSSSKVDLHTLNPKFDPEESKQGGIGLQNLRKRLEMIYPKQYELHINENKKTFETELSIDIPIKKPV